MSGRRVIFAGGGTGGHLYPALALADALRSREPDAEILFIGARRGVEARVLPDRAVPHVLLPLEPIRRDRPWRNWRLLPALVRSGAGLRGAFRRFRPDLVVGTGGYVSGPVVMWAMLHGIPTALQEQNSYPGLVTRRLAGRARQIHLAFPEAKRHLRPGRQTEVFVFGNPIAPPDLELDRCAARREFGLGDGPIALVVGGSQGARAINEALLGDLRAVAEGRLSGRPEGLEILWATGPNHHESVSHRLRSLALDSWVHPVPYIHNMPGALASADLAVSRAGAMALAELCAWGLASILIPYPHAAADHQYYNARALADAGAAILLGEDDLGGGRLWEVMCELARDRGRRDGLSAAARQRGHPRAAAEIVDQLVRLG